MKLSKGHKLITCCMEYFERDGDIHVAHVSLPVMPDGYRAGRFECTPHAWKLKLLIMGVIKPEVNTNA